MSKLYQKYLELKSTYPTTLFLFKSGIFYISLAEDATRLSEEFDFKLVNLNQDILKCGFPIGKLQYYAELLEHRNINFEIVDISSNTSTSYPNYSNNLKANAILNTLIKLDMNNITPMQSFDLLYKLSNDAKSII